MPATSILIVATTDLNTDQRLQRLAGSLCSAGHQVRLLGRLLPNSLPLEKRPFQQQRIMPWVLKGPLFYLLWQVQVLWACLLATEHLVIAVDMDTLPGAWLGSRLRNKHLMLDAHELFSEQEEVIARPQVHKAWQWVEQWFIPLVDAAMTVSQGVADEYQRRTGMPFTVVRNMPLAKPDTDNQPPRPAPLPAWAHPYLLYVGAVNKNRGLEQCIMAMQHHPYPLVICGDGPGLDMLKTMVSDMGLHDRVHFAGRINPVELAPYYAHASLGLLLLQGQGLNYYFSLANKFFDYVQHGLPQLVTNYPEYVRLLAEHQVGFLLRPSMTSERQEAYGFYIAQEIEMVIKVTYKNTLMSQNLHKAAISWTWENEEIKLIQSVGTLLNNSKV